MTHEAARAPRYRGNSKRVRAEASHEIVLALARCLDDVGAAPLRDLHREMANAVARSVDQDALTGLHLCGAAKRYWSPDYIQHSAHIAVHSQVQLAAGGHRRFASDMHAQGSAFALP